MPGGCRSSGSGATPIPPAADPWQSSASVGFCQLWHKAGAELTRLSAACGICAQPNRNSAAQRPQGAVRYFILSVASTGGACGTLATRRAVSRVRRRSALSHLPCKMAWLHLHRSVRSRAAHQGATPPKPECWPTDRKPAQSLRSRSGGPSLSSGRAVSSARKLPLKCLRSRRTRSAAA